MNRAEAIVLFWVVISLLIGLAISVSRVTDALKRIEKKLENE